MATQAQINFLKKALYLECRQRLLDNQGFDDPEYIKSFRDNYVNEKFGKNYKELSFWELKLAVDSLSKNAKTKDSRGTITYQQLSQIKYYALSIGLHYCSFDGLELRINGKPAEQAAAVAQLKKDFNNGKALPVPVIRHLYENWINPKCNEWLIEGGFRAVAQPKYLYYEQLSRNEASYLLARFTQFWGAQNKKDVNSHINLTKYN